MRAWRLENGFGFDSLKSVQLGVPEVSHGQVLVKIHAASLNYRDLLVLKGSYFPKLSFPHIPLSDASGEVVALGTGVTQWQIGDRVAANFMQQWRQGDFSEPYSRSALGAENQGILAEYVLFDQDGLVAIPPHLSYEQMATLPCAAVTAWNALVGGQNPVKSGDRVLLQGTGGVALFALQFAKTLGAETFLISSSNDKLNKAKSLGADHLLNYREVPDWEKWCRKVTNGLGVDHVIEVGGPNTLEKSFRAVRAGGHIALIGVLSGTGSVNPIPILMRSLIVRGIYVGSKQHFLDLNRCLTLHKIEPVIDRVFTFDQFPDSLHYLESGQHFGKIVLQLSGGE